MKAFTKKKTEMFSLKKATKFGKISTVDLFYVVTVKSMVEILQNFVAFSEYMNFKNEYRISSYSFLPWIISPSWILSSPNEETIQVFITQ